MKAALAICGQIGSGKSTASKFVAREFGFQLVSFSDFVRNRLVQEGRQVTRDSMQHTGDSLYRSMGAAGLVGGTLAHFGAGVHGSVVFDGVRHSDVLTAIKQSAAMSFTIYLDASRAERFRRWQERQGQSLPIDDFDRIDGHPVESGIPDLAKQCDLIIDASAPINAMREKLANEIRRWAR